MGDQVTFHASMGCKEGLVEGGRQAWSIGVGKHGVGTATIVLAL